MIPPPADLDLAAFLNRFGGVFERSPWIAEAAWRDRSAAIDTLDGLHSAMAEVLRAAPRERQHAVLLAHPDLAGRLALAGALTADSTSEQASAGLDRCSAEEFERFTALNQAYTARFGFPFIMAVRGKSRQEILAQFETRIDNSVEAEFAQALREVEQIARLRLRDLFEQKGVVR